jgi:hypothetical protein
LNVNAILPALSYSVEVHFLPPAADSTTEGSGANTTRIGDDGQMPGEYCQLADACACEIKRGADDESEMGVFRDL